MGLFALLGICWAASNNRKAISWRLVAWGTALQILFAVVILKTRPGYLLFAWLTRIFERLIDFTDDGARLVWGWLYKKDYPPIFLVDILMTIIFFSALMSLLYHFGIMQWVVTGLSRVLRKTMRTSGSETLAAAVNIFVGQTEAPLVVKPFVESMTLSELHAIMVGGFASIAGGVLAAYVTFGIDAGHMIAQSVMSAPASLVAAKMFYPETQVSVTAGDTKIAYEKVSVNALDAICIGAADGMKLVLNVVAMLLAFVSIIAMINGGLGLLVDGLTLEKIFGAVLAPMAWLMGIPWQDCRAVGGLLGTRMILNEFIAYLDLMKTDVSARAYVVATYALCGFANLGSIAIQIGGISAIAPSRRADLARLGMRAMLAGTLATFLTAAIAGALLTDEDAERDYRKNKARIATTAAQKIEQYDLFLGKYPNSVFAEEFRVLKSRAK
ncbi:MAG TPA: nucleoside transporter C-terminal domain-containing protein [Planctomycetota bacterium]|jgi:CNT family concentrative nucleoside transporter|nr:nucleoside transporter C-terminal domain-containing protein [Planctomycetota bacterium]